MPIRIPDALPAAAQLESENIFVMTEYRAMHQDIRPLRVRILNLMPTIIATGVARPRAHGQLITSTEMPLAKAKPTLSPASSHTIIVITAMVITAGTKTPETLSAI